MAPVFDPTWQVAFERQGDLWVARADGRSAHVMVRRARRPAWSRDGSKLAFLRDDGLWICVANGSHPHRVWQGKATSVSWHPSGRGLAIAARAAILDLDLRTGKARVITALAAPWQGYPQGSLRAPQWSPTGRFLAYVRDGDVWLARVNPGGWELQYVSRTCTYSSPTYRPDLESEGAERLAWSEDERHLADSIRNRPGFLRADSAGMDEMQVPPDARKIVEGPPFFWNGRPHNLAYAPDGMTLAAECRVEGRPPELRVAANDGSGRTRAMFADVAYPAWRPMPKPTFVMPPLVRPGRPAHDRDASRS